MGELKVQTLILTGVATDSCVLAMAIDAHMHRFATLVPPDCTAAQTHTRHRAAISMLGIIERTREFP
jgi:nicotinamidase-related amidase